MVFLQEWKEFLLKKLLFIIFQAEYAKSLRKLEEISESIHAQRKLKQKLNQFREPGVGAEEYLKSLPSYDLDDCYERSTVSGQSSSRIGMNFYLVKSDFTYISNFLTFYTFLAVFLNIFFFFLKIPNLMKTKLIIIMTNLIKMTKSFPGP